MNDSTSEIMMKVCLLAGLEQARDLTQNRIDQLRGQITEDLHYAITPAVVRVTPVVVRKRGRPPKPAVSKLSQGMTAYWAKFTERQRKAEMSRRAKLRQANRAAKNRATNRATRKQPINGVAVEGNAA